MNVLRWIVGEVSIDNKLCANMVCKTRDSAVQDLNDRLKAFEGLSTKDFTRHKGTNGTLAFKRDDRIIFIKKHMFK